MLDICVISLFTSVSWNYRLVGIISVQILGFKKSILGGSLLDFMTYARANFFLKNLFVKTDMFYWKKIDFEEFLH